MIVEDHNLEEKGLLCGDGCCEQGCAFRLESLNTGEGRGEESRGEERKGEEGRGGERLKESKGKKK